MLKNFIDSKIFYSCAALFWCIFLILFLTWSIFNPPIFKTNLSDLFAHSSSDERVDYNLKLLNQNSNKIMFVIEGKSPGEVKEAAKQFRSNINSAGLINVQFMDGDKALIEQIEESSARTYQMLNKSQVELLQSEQAVDLVKREILKKLSSPLSAYYSRFLEHDPLLLVPDLFLGNAAGLNGEFDKEGLFNFRNDQTILTIFADFFSQNISIEKQQSLLAKIDSEIRLIESEFNNLTIKWTGFPKFAVDSRVEMETEIKLYSEISFFLVFVLLFFCFRSVKPLILTFVTVTVGIFSGYVFVRFFQSSLHLITIGFGSCLVGASVDYAIHYLTHSAVNEESSVRTAKKVFIPITTGVFTTILSFMFLLFSEFSGLVELSLFAIGCLIGTYLTVFSLFPLLPQNWLKKNMKTLVLATKVKNQTRLVFTSFYGKIVFAVTFLFIAVVGIPQIEFNDDIRLLQPKNKLLVDEVKWIDERNHVAMPSAYLMVNENITIQTRENLKKFLQESKNNEFISGYIDSDPNKRSALEAEESLIAAKSFFNKNAALITQMFEEVGYPETTIAQLEDKIFKSNYEVSKNKSLVSNIALFGVKERDIFQANLENANLTLERGVVFYDQVLEINNLFENYRKSNLKQLLIAYLFIFVGLSSFYGLTSGSISILASFIGAALTLGTMGILGFSINFFSILALVIVLGLGVDFAIFLQKKDQSDTSVYLSVLISVLSTMLTFSLFAFSSAAVLQSLSAIISLGVIFSYCSANILILNRTSNNEKR